MKCIKIHISPREPVCSGLFSERPASGWSVSVVSNKQPEPSKQLGIIVLPSDSMFVFWHVPLTVILLLPFSVIYFYFVIELDNICSIAPHPVAIDLVTIFGNWDCIYVSPSLTTPIVLEFKRPYHLLAISRAQM